MDIFTQRKLLVRIVVLLTVLNLLSIGAFLCREYFRKPPPPDRSEENRDVAPFLEKELNLTEKQSEQMRKLRSGFSEKEKILSEIIRSQRDSMNAAMFGKSTDNELVISLAKKIAGNEYEMELLRFEQAKDFKSVCTPEQMEKFEGLVKEIRDYFKTGKEPKKK